MKNIDFLPARYRERRTARKSHVWRFVVVAAFGAAVGAAALGQYLLKQSIAAQVASVEQQHLLAQAKTQQFTELQHRLKEARARAQLFAYLRQPWPRTQILATLATPMSEEIALVEVTIARETATGPSNGDRRVRARTQRGEDEADARLLPAERDLKLLRDIVDGANTVVHVSGRTRDIPSLNRYVAALNEAPLIEQAELVSLEAVAEQGQPAASHFHVRLIIVDSLGATHDSVQTVANSNEMRTDG